MNARICRWATRGRASQVARWLILLGLAGLVSSSVQAGTNGRASAELELRESTYHPVSTRDPFMPAHAQQAATTAGPAAPQTDFRLQGVLYSPTNPAAIINDQVVVPNKLITLNTPHGPVEVKALEITKKRVILEVGGVKTELALDPATPPAR